MRTRCVLPRVHQGQGAGYRVGGTSHRQGSFQSSVEVIGESDGAAKARAPRRRRDDPTRCVESAPLVS